MKADLSHAITQLEWLIDADMGLRGRITDVVYIRPRRTAEQMVRARAVVIVEDRARIRSYIAGLRVLRRERDSQTLREMVRAPGGQSA